jgi:hypothetical protein
MVGQGITRTISYITLVGPQTRSTQTSTLGVAADVGGPLLNGTNGQINFPVTTGATLTLVASDNGLIQAGATYTATAVFTDGSQFVATYVYVAPANRWFQKSWLKNRITARVGQFAGQDSYGDQNFGKSFVLEPIGGPLDNLSNTFETFDPPSTPALEIRVVPIHNVYVKSMVSSVDRLPFSNNPTGLVPYFHGPPVSVSEIGFTPGKKASSTSCKYSTSLLLSKKS